MKVKLLTVIKSKKHLKGILERCGNGSNESIIADGLKCPYCGCLETYKDGKEPKNTEKWYFMIRPFRIGPSSECMNCGKWFE